MKRRISIILLTLYYAATLQGQRIEAELFGGLSNYQGDLQPIFITMTQSQPAGAVMVKYGITERIFVRGGISIGSLQGDDKVNKDELKLRNLRFRSGLKELHLAGEYRFFKPESFAVTPYVFFGGGVYHFNPYTNNAEGKRVYLQPLGTEGQGLPEYPQKKMYSLTQFCAVYGGGLRWQVNDNLHVGFEFGHRKLFTDYLDDVSGTFAGQEVLRNARGQMAVDLAYRRKEIDNKPYPNEGVRRANAGQNDWYYFAGFTIGFRISDPDNGGLSIGGIFKGRGRSSGERGHKRQLSCPANVW